MPRFRRSVAVGLILGLLAPVLIASGASAASAARTPLPAPGTPVLTQSTTTTAAFAWAPSSGPVASYTIQQLQSWSFVDIATVRTTSYTATNLAPDTTYEYRVVANAAARSSYTASAPSGVLYLTTRPLPDTVPPTKPGTPIAYSVGTVSATITVDGSTDNMRVAGYVAQRLIGGVWTDVATNNIPTLYLTGLTPATTYTVVVVAFDPNGNRSPQSEPVTFTTLATADRPSCSVGLITFNQGYLLDLRIQNLTTVALTNWTVTFNLPAEHTVSGLFGATLNRSASLATLSPVSWNATIAAGGGTSAGFSASYPGASALPSGFAINGIIPCSITPR